MASAWRSNEEEPVLDEETQERLRALGYLELRSAIPAGLPIPAPEDPGVERDIEDDHRHSERDLNRSGQPRRVEDRHQVVLDEAAAVARTRPLDAASSRAASTGRCSR